MENISDSSTDKSNRHKITEILLKMVLTLKLLIKYMHLIKSKFKKK